MKLMYKENIKLLMSWNDQEIDLFLYYFEQTLNQYNLEKTNQKSFFLNINYFENLISTFIVTNQYHSITHTSENFKFVKSSFLVSICFYLVEEGTFNNLSLKSINQLSLFFKTLLKKCLITESTYQSCIITMKCLNERIISDNGEHKDAKLISDIILSTNPTVVIANNEPVGILNYFGTIKDITFRHLPNKTFTKENVYESLFKNSLRIKNDFLKKHFMNKTQDVADKLPGDAFNVK